MKKVIRPPRLTCQPRERSETSSPFAQKNGVHLESLRFFQKPGGILSRAEKIRTGHPPEKIWPPGFPLKRITIQCHFSFLRSANGIWLTTVCITQRPLICRHCRFSCCFCAADDAASTAAAASAVAASAAAAAAVAAAASIAGYWLLLSRNLPPSTRRARKTRKWRTRGRFTTTPRARPKGIRKERRMATAILPHLAFF